MSTKTCVTGNNFILHKALIGYNKYNFYTHKLVMQHYTSITCIQHYTSINIPHSVHTQHTRHCQQSDLSHYWDAATIEIDFHITLCECRTSSPGDCHRQALPVVSHQLVETGCERQCASPTVSSTGRIRTLTNAAIKFHAISVLS